MKKDTGRPVVDLAKELHDTVCQTLTGAHLHLSVLARKVNKSAPDCAADLEELQQLLNRARTELQDIVKKIPE